MCMVRSLRILNRLKPRPMRHWQKSTGPDESNLMAIATTARKGRARSSSKAARTLSTLRLNTNPSTKEDFHAFCNSMGRSRNRRRMKESCQAERGFRFQDAQLGRFRASVPVHRKADPSLVTTHTESPKVGLPLE